MRRGYLCIRGLRSLEETGFELNRGGGEGPEQGVIPGGAAEITHRGLVGEERLRETQGPGQGESQRAEAQWWLQHQVTPSRALEKHTCPSQTVLEILAEVALTSTKG